MKTLVTTLVTLIVNTPFNTPLDEKIYVTGNFLNCDWKSDCLALEKVSPNQYALKVPLSSGQEFKITRGSWAKEAATSQGAPLKNLVSEGKKKQFVDVSNWKDLGPLKATGHIVRIKNFYSPELDNERDLQVRLPDSYFQSDKHYPVIYMHDGQNVFDPQTSSFGTDWSVDDVLSQRVAKGELRDAIVVGIYHKNRFREFNDEDKGRAYGEFIVQTLKPYIDKEFRTLKGRENTFTMGSSLGAAISVSLSFRYPHIFSKAAGLSFNASFFNDALFRMTTRFPMTETQIYLDHGSRGGDQKFGPHLKRFLRHLQGQGMPKGQIIYREFPGTNHTESDWARRVHIPLTFFLKEKRSLTQAR